MFEVQANLRFLLWKEGIGRNDWARTLANWIGCPETRAEEFLEGHGTAFSLTSKEKKSIAAKIGIQPEDLSMDLLEKNNFNVLAENIRHLVGTLPHGLKKQFASTLGVDATTISRWINHGQRPTKKKMDDICHYFGLSAGTNLETDPIFLRVDPISESQMRSWISEKINQVDGKTLREIFPALKRLLK